MARGLRAPLSPNEELTLRRVALGIALAKDLPAADVLRLRNLALIEDRGERFSLTALGKERYRRFHRTSGGAPDNAPDNAIDDEGKLGDVVQTFPREMRK
jgi:hypothetical protein